MENNRLGNIEEKNPIASMKYEYLQKYDHQFADTYISLWPK